MSLFTTPAGLPSLSAPDASSTDLVRRSWLKRLGSVLGLSLLGGPALASANALSPQAPNAADPYLGEIMMFAGNFAVRGWALCNGQLLSIAQNAALFSILGTTYGGNGQTTFALPNLQGRFPMHFGEGAGLSPRSLGEQAGQEQVTLIPAQMPLHGHVLNVAGGAGTTNTPDGNFLAAANGIDVTDESTVAVNAYAAGASGQANNGSVGLAGGSQPHSIMNPYLVLNFQIALQGIFPPRN